MKPIEIEQPPDIHYETPDICCNLKKVEPTYEINELQKNVKWPENSKKIEILCQIGKIDARVLIDTNGKVLKVVFDEKYPDFISDCIKEIKEGIKKTKFIPGKQGNLPIKCWIEIPIRFKLRD